MWEGPLEGFAVAGGGGGPGDGGGWSGGGAGGGGGGEGGVGERAGEGFGVFGPTFFAWVGGVGVFVACVVAYREGEDEWVSKEARQGTPKKVGNTERIKWLIRSPDYSSMINENIIDHHICAPS